MPEGADIRLRVAGLTCLVRDLGGIGGESDGAEGAGIAPQRREAA